jgi:hypothetical protein
MSRRIDGSGYRKQPGKSDARLTQVSAGNYSPGAIPASN